MEFHDDEDGDRVFHVRNALVIGRARGPSNFFVVLRSVDPDSDCYLNDNDEEIPQDIIDTLLQNKKLTPFQMTVYDKLKKDMLSLSAATILLHIEDEKILNLIGRVVYITPSLY